MQYKVSIQVKWHGINGYADFSQGGGKMKVLRTLGLLCTALVVTWSSIQPWLPEVQLPPERIAQKGYSLVSLNEKGWRIVERNAYQLALAKRGENTDETMAIQVILFRLPVFKTNEEFLRLIQEGQVKDTDPQRFKIMQHEVTTYRTKGTDCAKSHIAVEDRDAVKRSGKPGDMVLEIMALTCAHPKDKNFGISIIYSQRYYSEQRDSAFVEKAMSVLHSIEFTDL